ncbi:Guanylate kinase [Rubripirellula obstinata]|uniref:Guanylate kinase n=1 Tax=Rubripirellula obstinata TaxID=406547 RepID=A0A5B1CPL1_9BACT|nr:guanylate kinase [Rubripirellula obstinata]KAA1261214.1 Guanylate kinase [Rubripirellula obstinata]
MASESKGRLIIVSGPSGAGKSTVLRELRSRCELPLAVSVSATTRQPRPGEIDKVDYFFLSPQEFEQRRKDGEFLECKEVFGRGHWYGTLRDQVATGLNQGKWVILEIDVQGAMTILDNDLFNPVTLFLHPGSMEELENRLRSRGTEDEAAITARLETAGREMAFMHHYQYEIINGDVDIAVTEICEILKEKKGKQSCSKS